jgi:glycerophosphoryl diester phosphodiesterase
MEKRTYAVVIAALLAVAGGVAVLYGAEVWPEKVQPKDAEPVRRHIMLAAHRGVPQKAPENSIAGFREAIREGAVFIELDLVLSGDSVIYVSHDRNLWRTTGRNIEVSRARSWELDGVRLRGGEKLPRLSEVFDALGDRVFYIIETKDIGGETARRMDRALVGMIRQYRLERQVVLSSQSMASLKTLHGALGQAPYMYIFARRYPGDSPEERIKTLPAWVDAVSMSKDIVTKQIIRAARARGVRIALFTVTDRRGMKQALKYAPAIIFTDDVGMSINYLEGTRFIPAARPCGFRHLRLFL